MLPHEGCGHQGVPFLQSQARDCSPALLPPRLQELACHKESEVVTMATRWIVGHLFDGWRNLCFAIEEAGKAIDRAWEGDDDWPDRDSVLA